jgi:hypothetical protein
MTCNISPTFGAVLFTLNLELFVEEVKELHFLLNFSAKQTQTPHKNLIVLFTATPNMKPV